jgi:hypothetical protein
MSNAALSQPSQPKWPAASSTTSVVAVVLTAWFVLIVLLGASGAFATPPGVLPLPIAVGVTAPIVVFLSAYWMSRQFREFVLTADLRLVAGIHAWRAVGFGFLALYAYGVLPGLFALPAGLGDIAIGVTAPWIVLALIRRPDFAASKTFVVWNLLGLLDLAVAVGTGALGSGLATGIAGEITTAPMAQLPLVLVPAYLVPIFIMLHLTALFQVRRLGS